MTCNPVFASIASIALLTGAHQLFVPLLRLINYSAVVAATEFAVRTKQKRSNQNFQSSLDVNGVNLQAPFKFLVHGWLDWGNNSWIQEMSYAFLDRGDYNVIAVNWHSLAQQAYPTSARSSRQVGKSLSLNNYN